MAKEIKLHEIEQISHITACIFTSQLQLILHGMPYTSVQTTRPRQIHSGLPDQKNIVFRHWHHFIQSCITSFSPNHFIQSASLHSAWITSFSVYHFIQPASLHSACITSFSLHHFIQPASLHSARITLFSLHHFIQSASLHNFHHCVQPALTYPFSVTALLHYIPVLHGAKYSN